MGRNMYGTKSPKIVVSHGNTLHNLDLCHKASNSSVALLYHLLARNKATVSTLPLCPVYTSLPAHASVPVGIILRPIPSLPCNYNAFTAFATPSKITLSYRTMLPSIASITRDIVVTIPIFVAADFVVKEVAFIEMLLSWSEIINQDIDDVTHALYIRRYFYIV